LNNTISNPISRIIVAIDFSGDSMNALKHAMLWCNAIQCDMRLLHIQKKEKYDVPEYFENLETQHTKSIEDILIYLVDKYRKNYNVKNGIFDYVVREGRVHTEITEYAANEESALIIMGTHGVSGFEEYWVGSTAFKVVMKSPCPVLTIRNGFPIVMPKRIVVPIDVTNQTRQKVPLMAELAGRFGSEIHLLGVRETETKEVITRINQYVDQVAEYLENKGVSLIIESSNGGNITDLTIEYAKEVDADLISIMTEQTERPENLWLGPYAQQMVNHSPIPVLSMHPIE
jgi:nucleotide-binding universal stress UspA family protein